MDWNSISLRPISIFQAPLAFTRSAIALVRFFRYYFIREPGTRPAPNNMRTESVELESIQPATGSCEIVGPELRRKTCSDKCKDGRN